MPSSKPALHDSLPIELGLIDGPKPQLFVTRDSTEPATDERQRLSSDFLTLQVLGLMEALRLPSHGERLTFFPFSHNRHKCNNTSQNLLGKCSVLLFWVKTKTILSCSDTTYDGLVSQWKLMLRAAVLAFSSVHSMSFVVLSRRCNNAGLWPMCISTSIYIT